MSIKMPPMAKNKPRKPAVEPPAPDEGQDRHYSRFMIRLPDDYREMLRSVQREIYDETGYRVSLTDIVRKMIDKGLTDRGHTPPTAELDD